MGLRHIVSYTTIHNEYKHQNSFKIDNTRKNDEIYVKRYIKHTKWDWSSAIIQS